MLFVPTSYVSYSFFLTIEYALSTVHAYVYLICWNPGTRYRIVYFGSAYIYVEFFKTSPLGAILQINPLTRGIGQNCPSKV